MSYIGNSPGVASQRVETTLTATAGQTVFTPSSGYTLGYCDVYQNGVKLVNGDDYTASNGATVTLTTGAASGDSIVIVASFPRGLSDGYLKTESDGRFVKVDGSNNMTGGLNVTIGGTSVLGGATNPVVAMAKGATGYVQSYLINTTNGTSSSADIVAYPNNGTDASGWVDMGITSSSYADTTYTVTGPNEAYLFGSAPSGAGKTGNLVIATDSTGTANSIQFYTNGFTQAKSAAKMTLDGATGNLLIGRTSGSERLSVQNQSATSTTVGANVIAGFRSFGAGADTCITLTDGASYSSNFGQIAGNFYWMPGGSTERMRLDISGNLGLGVTPSAWGTTGTFLKAVEIAGAGVSVAGVNNRAFQIDIQSNAYYNAGWKFASAANYAAQYEQYNGNHTWFTSNAQSIASGSAISFTQTMGLDTAGKLYLGQTTGFGALNVQALPSSGYSIVSTNDATLNYSQIYFAGTTSSAYTYIRADGRSTGYISFGTADTERMRIDSSGNVGVGLPSPTAKLHVQKTSPSAPLLQVDNNVNYGLVVDQNLNVLVGTNSSPSGQSNQLKVPAAYANTSGVAANGIVYSDGIFGRSTSALKYKQDVRDLEAIDISIFRPVRYKSKCERDDPTVDYIGFIADEYVVSRPELVCFGENGEVENFAYERMTAILCKALQEQQALITQLQADVAALKGTA